MKTHKNNLTRDGVIHFSTSDASGAFTATYRIHQSILKLGYRSILFVQRKTRKEADIIEVGTKPKAKGLLSRVLSKSQSLFTTQAVNYCFFDRMSYTLSSSQDVVDVLPFRPKVIFIHWTSGFLDTDIIIDLQKKFGSTVYCTFMDTAPLTGGCHYSWDCLGYTQDCGNCPAVNFWDKELPKLNLKKKIDFVNSVSAIPITSISWMKKKIEISSVFGDRVCREFSLGIDSKVFCPGSKKIARDNLGLPHDKVYILVAASSLDDPRKGVEYAHRAVAQLVEQRESSLENVEILLAGKLGKFSPLKKWALPTRYIGRVKGDKSLVDLYRASDVFLSPSIEDAGPMMVGESMLCGTPVLSFDVGQACDLIQSSESGFIVPTKDYIALAQALSLFLCLNQEAIQSLSDNARRSAVSRVSITSQNEILENLLTPCTSDKLFDSDDID